jgi:putative transposase
VKYALILHYAGEFSISLMCRVLSVSRSGYYSWKKRKPSNRQQRREQFELLIKDTYEDFLARYGSRRITEELIAAGFPCSPNFVAKLMQENNIKAYNGKGFNYRHQSLTMVNVADNLLWREFSAQGPNEKWTTDITYIWVRDRWMYLAVVMDLFSRRIVGWAVDTSMTEDLVTEALSIAFGRRGIHDGLILHSDRGVQYRSQKYIDFASSHGCRMSMSRKGNCWDNAPMESFFSRLKVELIYPMNYQSIEEAKAGLFEYIEVFYNRKRRHSSIGYVSPYDFEKKMALVA